MNHGKLFEQIFNPANRHNPYPLYAQLRKIPISQQEDGTYVVSTGEIEALLYDPRISSDERKSTRGAPLKFRVRREPAFILLDPPDHNPPRQIPRLSVGSSIHAWPPPYRELATLRGPQHLAVNFDLIGD
jgi:cytochrome P450